VIRDQDSQSRRDHHVRDLVGVLADVEPRSARPASGDFR
jgi:hypothetical protein